MSKIFFHGLMTMSSVLIQIIGQNCINSKLLQPIVASIRKIMAVKKPCVSYCRQTYIILLSSNQC